MPVFDQLQLWIDPVRRSGAEAMAVDEWLLETVSCPVLRVYSWAGEWASIGYFGRISEAREWFPSLHLVRRWTGGGMVDHRSDWTYTLVVPQGEALAKSKGAAGYQMIHQKLFETLNREGVDCRMSSGEEATGSACCFENPVGFDLIGDDGRKLAGAGQRRSKSGLLHQGSVSIPCGDAILSSKRAENFAGCLAHRWADFTQREDAGDLERRVEERYSCPAWINRR